MAVFPEISSVPYMAPVGKGVQFKTLVQEFESGIITRKKKRTYPLRPYRLINKNIDYTEVQIYFQFFIARAGRFEDFVFFDRNSNYFYIKEYVGTGDGSTTEFNLPSLNATDYTLYIDNVAQSEGEESGSSGVDWTFHAADGDDGEDTCKLAVAAADGERITFSFTGRLKIRCIFAEDEMGFEEFWNKLVTTGINLKGLLNT